MQSSHCFPCLGHVKISSTKPLTFFWQKRRIFSCSSLYLIDYLRNRQNHFLEGLKSNNLPFWNSKLSLHYFDKWTFTFSLFLVVQHNFWRKNSFRFFFLNFIILLISLLNSETYKCSTKTKKIWQPTSTDWSVENNTNKFFRT